MSIKNDCLPTDKSLPIIKHLKLSLIAKAVDVWTIQEEAKK